MQAHSQWCLILERAHASCGSRNTQQCIKLTHAVKC
jgi:hypothetical protein